MKTIKAVKIEPSHAGVVVEVGNDLESLQAAVGGYLEVIRLDDGTVALIDEEAKLKANPPPPNVLATNIARAVGIRPDDYIRGPMLIVGTLDPDGADDGEFHDVPRRWEWSVIR
jgi:hypothetical protein